MHQLAVFLTLFSKLCYKCTSRNFQNCSCEYAKDHVEWKTVHTNPMQTHQLLEYTNEDPHLVTTIFKVPQYNSNYYLQSKKLPCKKRCFRGHNHPVNKFQTLTMLAVILDDRYFIFLHCANVRIGTLTCCTMPGNAPPSDVRPQPTATPVLPVNQHTDIFIEFNKKWN